MGFRAFVKRGRKWREGRGFSRGELREVGLSFTEALKLRIPIDPKRSTEHSENVEALKRHLGVKTRAEALEPSLSLTEVRGIGQKRSEKLEAAGVHSVQQLVESDPHQLAEEVGISAKRIVSWIKDADKKLSNK